MILKVKLIINRKGLRVGWVEGESLHGTVRILTQKKILRKKKKGVWCSLHRCTRKLIDSQWKGIRVERRNRSKDFSLTRGIVFLKGNCFFDGKIPFPPHFPSKSGTCTMMPSHMRKIIWLSLFYACIFCGMMSLVQGTWTLLSKFGFPFPPPPASSYSSIIHLSSPTKRYPAKTMVLMSLLSLKTQATLEHDINIFTQMLVCIIL